MKKLKYIKLIIAMIVFQVFSFTAFAQMMAPEDPGGEPVGEDPIGGGAPLSGGTLILTILGAFYGVKKIYDRNREANPL